MGTIEKVLPTWNEMMFTLDVLQEYTDIDNEGVARIIGKDPRKGLMGWGETEYRRYVELENFTAVIKAFKPNSEVARSWMSSENAGIGFRRPIDLLRGDAHERTYLVDRMRASIEDVLFRR